MSAPISQALWDARIPLYITHPSAPTAPFITSIPRFSYLALLLPRLSAFFNTPCSSFHFEDVLLRNLAAGLLVDLYQPSLPWRLVVNDGVSWDISDTFLNAAKEADFIRNANANQIMKMSKSDTTQLWHAVIDNDYAAFSRINNRLLNAPTALKHVPMRVYLPLVPVGSASGGGQSTTVHQQQAGDGSSAGAFKVLQSLVQPLGTDRKPRLLGHALKEMMPKLFPSSRDPVMANVLLHGVAVPFDAPLADLMREAAYPDGWLSFVVVIL
ncbi:autophagy protein 5 [Cordyceps militaris CM01]|uniref:Autophagy protein 5 n=2 Tax=Cordyceps militaris TaxID=73501 RepID=G3J6X8_CORMM|nr:autophagy protein 5 [Cordyceps militaris CM01]ATY61495.1 autophagy 5 [Cordyceps militaris]EGX96255.1 autophagy protein 5 [Cordyceps militaris CM01]